MTLIPWTSVFVALAFTLHTVSAVLQPMNLGFVLKREIIIENVPRGLEYGFDPTTSAMMWAFVGPPTVTVGDLKIRDLAHQSETGELGARTGRSSPHSIRL
jgi:hypothetical protein